MIGKQLLGVVLVTAVASTSVASASILQDGSVRGQGRNFDRPMDRQEMMQIMEDGDYQAWKDHMLEMGRDNVVEKISEADFAKLVEMHEAMEARDFETAKAIREDLGLPERGNRNGQAMRGPRDVSAAPWFRDLPESVQTDLEAAHKAGDRDKVKEILDSNDIQPKFPAKVKLGNRKGRSQK